MTVKQLRAFLAVAQSLSFAQACERLHLSQPALSLAIKNLEQSLGGQLLVRTTRSVALTPEGETLLPIAVRLLADWDNAEDLLRQHFTLQMGKVAAMVSTTSSMVEPSFIMVMMILLVKVASILALTPLPKPSESTKIEDSSVRTISTLSPHNSSPT